MGSLLCCCVFVCLFVLGSGDLLLECVCEFRVIVEQDLSHLSRVITSAAHNQFLLEGCVVFVLRNVRGDFPVIEGEQV